MVSRQITELLIYQVQGLAVEFIRVPSPESEVEDLEGESLRREHLKR